MVGRVRAEGEDVAVFCVRVRGAGRVVCSAGVGGCGVGTGRRRGRGNLVVGTVVVVIVVVVVVVRFGDGVCSGLWWRGHYDVLGPGGIAEDRAHYSTDGVDVGKGQGLQGPGRLTSTALRRHQG